MLASEHTRLGRLKCESKHRRRSVHLSETFAVAYVHAHRLPPYPRQLPCPAPAVKLKSRPKPSPTGTNHKFCVETNLKRKNSWFVTHHVSMPKPLMRWHSRAGALSLTPHVRPFPETQTLKLNVDKLIPTSDHPTKTHLQVIDQSQGGVLECFKVAGKLAESF